jgi:mono/diheme cytochrome c family protein
MPTFEFRINQDKPMRILLSLIFLPLLSTAVSVHARDIDAGSLYADYCSVCHGDNGDGESHAKQGMFPPPRDFTSPSSAVELTRPRIINAIRNGIPGSAMSSWKSRLDNDQIEALADLLQSRFMLPGAATSATEGSRIYSAYCSVCHGDSGQGALWATAGLSPRPADFPSSKFQSEMTRDHMIQSVSYGRPETAMTGWKKRLTDKQIEIVVDYVIGAFMPQITGNKLSEKSDQEHSEGHTHQHTHADPDTELGVYMNQQLANGLQGNAERGQTLYLHNCATCHGEQGDGRGPRAYFINPKPRNFLHAASRASLNRPTLQRIISKGKLRTEMPAWEKVFDAQQIADVGEFVFVTFIQH